MGGVWLGVIGPVQCVVDGRPVEVPGRLDRALLAALAVEGRRVSTVDDLVSAMWGAHPPGRAQKVVRNRVSRLRAALAPEMIQTNGAGYRLGSSVVVDTSLFEDADRPSAERLALWRGEPFVEISEWPPARAAGVRLLELRAHLEEVAIAERLEAGADPDRLVGEAEQLVETEPYRERRWALLMRLLYLAGRQRDALDAFSRARLLLRDQLGVMPGAELLEIERSILQHDSSLAAVPQKTRSTNPPLALFGRDDDAQAVHALLGEHRLVTLVGLGGVGKTSLARELSKWRKGRSFFIDLSATEDGGSVGEVAARSLGIAVRQSAPDAISGWAIDTSPCLVVLDNCEHLRDDALEVANALLVGQGPRILTTSRIPLGHPDESVYRLEPLERQHAIALFHARADKRRRFAPDDGTVDRLCQVLSDVPLAIELAAARSAILSPSDMLDDLKAVTTASPIKVRAIHWRSTTTSDVIDVVAWAVQALSRDAITLLRRCSIFPGGFTKIAAKTTIDGDLDDQSLTQAFAELAEASLIDVRFETVTRYQYLDLVRQRADELLDQAGERRLASERMVRWAVAETDHLTYTDLPRLLAETTNLAAAARFACAQGDVDAALRITGATFALLSAERAELLDSKLAAVELPGAAEHPRYLRSCAELAFALFVQRGDMVAAQRYAQIVLEREADSRSAGWANFTLGHMTGELSYVRKSLAIARDENDPLLQFYASCLTIDNAGQGGAKNAEDLVLESQRVAEEINEPWALIMATIVRGMALCQPDPSAALVHLERAAALAERSHLNAYSTVARSLAGLASTNTEPRTRLEMTKRGLIDAERANVSYLIVLALARMAQALTDLGDVERAAIIAGAANTRFHSKDRGAARFYQIDRQDHHNHEALYDLGATMNINELLAVIDRAITEIGMPKQAEATRP